MLFGKNSRRRPVKVGAARVLAEAARCVCVSELLELRRLLSGTQYVVNSLLDVVAADGVVTLREAIQAASTDTAVNEAPAGSATDTDTITFDPGLFADGSHILHLSGGELPLAGAISVTGPGASLLSIDAGGDSRVLNVGTDAVASIGGLTLAGGNLTSGFGAGVYNSGSLSMTDVVIDGNHGVPSSGPVTGAGLYNSGTAALSHVTITNNSIASQFPSAGRGGGIFNSGTLTMSDSSISHNQAAYGGGIYSTGTLQMTDAAIERNSATDQPTGFFQAHLVSGGGIYNAGTATLSRVAISQNGVVLSDSDVQSAGGGVFNASTGDLAITDATIDGNGCSASAFKYADAGGGGISNSGKLVVKNTTIAANTTMATNSLGIMFAPSASGGGVSNERGGDLTMTNVAVVGNSANATVAVGGGINNFGSMRLMNVTVSGGTLISNAVGYAQVEGAGILSSGTTTLVNVTISGNSSPDTGGGLSLQVGQLTVQNTIVAGNTAGKSPDLHGTLSTGSDYNLIGVLDPSQLASAGAHSLSGTVAAPLDPKLGPLTTINGMPVLPVLAGSPAINAGSNALAVDAGGNPLTTDEAGQPRIAGGTVDIGAYEYQPQSLLVNGTSGDDAISISGDANTLSWKIGAAGQLSIPRSLVSAIRIDASQGTDALSFDVDLLDDALIIEANPDTRAQLLQAASDAVKAGRTKALGSRIITSAGAAEVPQIHGLATILNEKLDDQDKPKAILGSIAGVALDTNSIIVAYALNGDTDLNGIVNFDDYYLINTGFLSNGALGGYRNGDFNYDAVINFDDYYLIHSAFLGQSGGAASAPAAAVARPADQTAKARRREVWVGLRM